MAKKKQAVNTRSLTRLLFVAYIAFMLWLLFVNGRGSEAGLPYWEQVRTNMNLTPLRTIGNYLYVLQHSQNKALWQHCFINLAGNVLLFIPAGLLLPRIWYRFRTFWKYLLCCLLSVGLIEAIQLFSLRGSLDVDDLILNLSGMLLGYIAYRITHRKKEK